MAGRGCIRAAWLCGFLALAGEFLPGPQAAPEAKDSARVSLALPQADSAGTGTDSIGLRHGRADSVVLIKHRFNHKEQIITGGVIMACLAAMMAVMNNYNPR